MRKLISMLTSVAVVAAMSTFSAVPALADHYQWRGTGKASAYARGYRNGRFDQRRVNALRFDNRRFDNRRGFNRNLNHWRGNGWNNRNFNGHPFNGRRFNDRDGLSGTEAAIIGSTVGVVGLAILSQNRRQTEPQTVIVQQQPPLGQGAVAQRRVVTPAQQFNSCLQTREYQTTVTIGGVLRDAYGTACLQPDGTWLKGAATPVP